MAEYIELEAALNRLCQENCGHDFVEGKCHNCYTGSFLTYIPAADVALVVHGHIVPAEQPKKVLLDGKCVKCNSLMLSTDKFCPSCGARMDGE